jgi:serine/threonine protein phosphatase PrpC
MPLVRVGSIVLARAQDDDAELPLGVSFGAAQRATHKDEDICTMQAGAGSEAACFAVFDGHGGVLAARRCDEVLAPRLVALAPCFAPAEVEREFWRVDSELGAAGVPDGTTATVLLVSRGKAAGHPGLDDTCDSVHSTASTLSASSTAQSADSATCDPAALVCALAHVGDSTAIRVDMCRRAGCLLRTALGC